MASKSRSKIKRNQIEVGDRTIDLQRFAYDVVSYSALKFDVPESCILKWEGEDNDYGCSDFILVLSRIFLKYQITERNLWHSACKSRYGSNKFESFENIRQLLQQLLKLSTKKAAGCILHEVILSLSLINEMVVFLYSKACNLHLQELIRFWLVHLAPLKKKFEKAGGLAELYKTYDKPKYESVDDFYDEFIQGFCFPYDDPEVLSNLNDIFHAEGDRYFRELSEDLSEAERIEYHLMMHNTVWRDSRHIIVSQHRVKVNKALEGMKREKSSGKDIPENIGIPQHEEHASKAADEKLSPNRPDTSCQEPTKEHAESSQEKHKNGNPIHGQVCEDLEKLNLDFSES